MAHHNSAKKRIRRNARRYAINHNRISRIRTFVKKVELAVVAGNKEAAGCSFEIGGTGTGARCNARRLTPQHRCAQNIAFGGLCAGDVINNLTLFNESRAAWDIRRSFCFF